MKSSAECYNIVKKDCFKFIKLQETPKEKFKNKINLTENPEIVIWGIVTYVIHAL